jgi:hypothetical protein
MCTFDTVSSARSSEGYNAENALKNRAKTAAKINVQKAHGAMSCGTSPVAI